MVTTDSEKEEYDLFLDDWKSFRKLLEAKFKESKVLNRKKPNVDLYCEEIDTIVENIANDNSSFFPILKKLISELEVEELDLFVGINASVIKLRDSCGNIIKEKQFINKRIKKVVDEFIILLNLNGLTEVTKQAFRNLGTKNKYYENILNLYPEDERPINIEDIKSSLKWQVVRKGRNGSSIDEPCGILSKYDKLSGFYTLKEMLNDNEEVDISHIIELAEKNWKFTSKLNNRQLRIFMNDFIWKFALSNLKTEYVNSFKRTLISFMNQELIKEDEIQPDFEGLKKELYQITSVGSCFREKLKIAPFKAYDQTDNHRYVKIFNEKPNIKRKYEQDNLKGNQYSTFSENNYKRKRFLKNENMVRRDGTDKFNPPNNYSFEEKRNFCKKCGCSHFKKTPEHVYNFNTGYYTSNAKEYTDEINNSDDLYYKNNSK